MTALRFLSLLISPLLPGPRAIPGVDPKSPTRLRRLDWNTGLCNRGSGRCPSLVTPTWRVQRGRGPDSICKDLSMPFDSGFPLGLGGTLQPTGPGPGNLGGLPGRGDGDGGPFSQRVVISFGELKAGLSSRVCVPGLVQGTLAVTYLLGWLVSFFLSAPNQVSGERLAGTGVPSRQCSPCLAGNKIIR